MTPERLSYLQETIKDVRVDWDAERIVWVDEPPASNSRMVARVVEGTNVVQLERISAVEFRLNASTVALVTEDGEQASPDTYVKWIEAEGYVIFAWAEDPSGMVLAASMVGKPVPKRRSK